MHVLWCDCCFWFYPRFIWLRTSFLSSLLEDETFRISIHLQPAHSRPQCCSEWTKNCTFPRSWRWTDILNVSSASSKREVQSQMSLGMNWKRQSHYHTCVVCLSWSRVLMLEEVDIRVRFRPNTTLRKPLVKPKDPVPVECRTGIVYQIPCKNCSQVYVGQSGPIITDRIKEHQWAVKNGDTKYFGCHRTSVEAPTQDGSASIRSIGLQPASFLKMYARVVASPVWLHERRAQTSPCFVSFFVDIIMISHF